jgi:hypothetical protein
VSPRVRAAGPWAVTTAVLAVIVCAVGWPTLTGWAVGGTVGAVALVVGLHLLLEERREKTAPRSSTCAGCAGCGGPDCVQNPVLDELTAEEARSLADELGRELYQAQDALAYVAEMCDIADEHRGKRGEPATVTTTRVREWLKGAQCARQAGLILPPDALGPATPGRTDHP